MIVVAGDFNAAPDEVPVQAICGDVEDTGNGDLARRVLVPIENTIPESSRYTLFHHGRGELLDHMLVTRNLELRFLEVDVVVQAGEQPPALAVVDRRLLVDPYIRIFGTPAEALPAESASRAAAAAVAAASRVVSLLMVTRICRADEGRRPGAERRGSKRAQG